MGFFSFLAAGDAGEAGAAAFFFAAGEAGEVGVLGMCIDMCIDMCRDVHGHVHGYTRVSLSAEATARPG